MPAMREIRDASDWHVHFFYCIVIPGMVHTIPPYVNPNGFWGVCHVYIIDDQLISYFIAVATCPHFTRLSPLQLDMNQYPSMHDAAAPMW